MSMSSNPRIGKEFFFVRPVIWWSSSSVGEREAIILLRILREPSLICPFARYVFLVSRRVVVSRASRVRCHLSTAENPSWWYPSAFKCISPRRHWEVVSPDVCVYCICGSCLCLHYYLLGCRPRRSLLDDDDSWGLLTKATNHGGLDKSCLPVTISQSENDSATSTLVHKSNARTEGRKQASWVRERWMEEVPRQSDEARILLLLLLVLLCWRKRLSLYEQQVYVICTGMDNIRVNGH